MRPALRDAIRRSAHTSDCSLCARCGPRCLCGAGTVRASPTAAAAQPWLPYPSTSARAQGLALKQLPAIESPRPTAEPSRHSDRERPRLPDLDGCESAAGRDSLCNGTRQPPPSVSSTTNGSTSDQAVGIEIVPKPDPRCVSPISVEERGALPTEMPTLLYLILSSPWKHMSFLPPVCVSDPLVVQLPTFGAACGMESLVPSQAQGRAPPESSSQLDDSRSFFVTLVFTLDGSDSGESRSSGVTRHASLVAAS
ncbi:hypothetical protein JB92DRAFT_2053847 [Gautieria morchelliformis]|nr:hypothetical protein JB92DRAFT_2053847 [Gautieria morchelliformis]